ncbi:hypothetical protein CBR_g26316 [Chara braunii]|uniref:Uncharacterized protein n=1 Tax=Chara braunii TaxID=69332 RepID=A0A388L7L0_CHABU|nr:hypothetical protein CBR_g26316 [Chara braunii]|eukprot:GBG78285.1 hypothetical protein CBR_g26316 [Chara braunii]
MCTESFKLFVFVLMGEKRIITWNGDDVVAERGRYLCEGGESIAMMLVTERDASDAGDGHTRKRSEQEGGGDEQLHRRMNGRGGVGGGGGGGGGGDGGGGGGGGGGVAARLMMSQPL